ncbi:MAG: four helix bundle protein [Chloroflexi bacterium]|nr:four helix bundle protein [Chloroflexota bacterium]MBI3761025.1 four helix bundle protein [Chloroflexota bacterium]
MPAKDHRELRVYQLAFESAVSIYEVTKSFPAEERYSLTDQIRRSSRSVCANIAEAWRKRRYPKNFVSKLSDADAEATETLVWLDFALRFGYLSVDQHKSLADRYDHICSQLALMMAEPHKWVPKSASAK